MSTARKILSNTVAQVIGKFIVALLGLAVLKIATNYLSVEGYGEYVAIYEFLAFFGIAADLGLFTIAVKEMSHDEKKIPQIIGNILSLRTILVIATMLIAILTIFLIPEYADTRIPIGVAIASLTVVFTIINGTLTSVLQTKLQMQYASLTTTIGKIISVGLMVYIAFFGFPTESELGFHLLIAAGVVGNLVMLLSTTYFVKKITPISYKFDFELWKKVFVKALPYGIALILNTIYFRIDSLFILFIRGQEEVGVYGVAMKMLENFSIIPLYFMNSVLPVLTKSIKEKSQRYKIIISHAFDFLAALSIPIVVGGFILAFPIIFIVSSPEFLSDLSKGFYGSDIALQILIFALLFQFLNVLFSFILIAVNQQTKLLYINAVCVAFNIITNLIFIPIYGFVGAAITSVICEFYILIANYFFAKKYLDFSISFKNLTKIIISSLIMGAFIYLLQPITYKYLENWNILILVPFGMIIYGGMLILTKTINKETINLFKKGEKLQHDNEESTPLT